MTPQPCPQPSPLPCPLPAAFLATPITHRALHDLGDGRPENSPAAIRAAVSAGFGIEIDLQLSADGQVMVFHDYDLDRLCDKPGKVQDYSAAELQKIPLTGSTAGDTIPTLGEVLEMVAGKVPLLIEVKDQDGALGPNTDALEKATARVLDGYLGPVALMSFNPHSIAACARYAPDIPRGLVTGAFLAKNWDGVPESRLAELRSIPDYGRVGASFISHRATDLNNPHVANIRAKKDAVILCWTIRSLEADAQARKIADNVTFEGYIPA